MKLNNSELKIYFRYVINIRKKWNQQIFLSHVIFLFFSPENSISTLLMNRNSVVQYAGRFYAAAL